MWPAIGKGTGSSSKDVDEPYWSLLKQSAGVRDGHVEIEMKNKTNNKMGDANDRMQRALEKVFFVSAIVVYMCM